MCRIVNKDGLLVDPTKIAIIIDLLAPTSTHDLREDLGHIGYYMKYMHNYAMIIVLLGKLIKREEYFHWTEECPRAFNQLE